MNTNGIAESRSLALNSAPPATTSSEQEAYTLHHCSDAFEVREAQKLRWRIFTEEYGAQLKCQEYGVDEDEFDAYCDHLIVRESRTGQAVGTYRLLNPSAARALGRYYTETEFNLGTLGDYRHDIVELGRSCVHPDHRSGGVIMLLWAGIAKYMKAHKARYLIGCASVSLRDGGKAASTLWQRFQAQSADANAFNLTPLHPAKLSATACDQVELPPLIKGYLRVGAKVCGAPSWDPDFNTADFPILMDLNEINPRYAKHFGI